MYSQLFVTCNPVQRKLKLTERINAIIGNLLTTDPATIKRSSTTVRHMPADIRTTETGRRIIVQLGFATKDFIIEKSTLLKT